jgi:branched-chain amino acid transport system substrate-binding protein
MAVEDFGGEVLGQKIEIVTADHQDKPDLATAIARRWYDSEGVEMITELTSCLRRGAIGAGVFVRPQR